MYVRDPATATGDQTFNQATVEFASLDAGANTVRFDGTTARVDGNLTAGSYFYSAAALTLTDSTVSLGTNAYFATTASLKNVTGTFGSDLYFASNTDLENVTVTVGHNAYFASAVVLRGSNSFTATGTLFTFSGSVDGPGSLQIDQGAGAETRIDGQVGVGTNVGSVVVNGGTFAATTSNLQIRSTGSVTADDFYANGAGTASITAATSIQLGGLQPSAPLLLTAPSKTLSGAIDTTGAIQLAGGTTTWNVTSQTSAQVTRADNDALTWSAAAPARPIELINGGVFAGTGTTTTISTLGPGSGIVAPGTTAIPVGTVTALGNVGGAGGLGMRIDSTSAATDLLNVTGAVTLGGALTISTGTGPIGTPRTIITNDSVDAVIGTFTGVPEGAEVTGTDGSFHTVSYAGGDGNDVTITRNQYTSSTALAQSAATSQTGSSLTLTATVTSTHGSPTGTVTFKSGATTIGTASVVAGVATFTTSTLAAGSYDFVAEYAESPGHTGSTSSSVAHTRTAPPSGTNPSGTNPTGTNPTGTDPTTNEPPALREPGLRASRSCVAMNRTMPTLTYLLSRNARVSYRLERRATPTRFRARRSCRTASGRAKYHYDRIAATTRTTTAGRVRMPVQRLLGTRHLAPGIYRVRITIHPTSGGDAITRATSFVVAWRD